VHPRPIEVFNTDGAPLDRGKALGVGRRQPIQSCLAAWLASLNEAGISDPEQYLSEMLRSTTFIQSIQKHAPDLLDEVRGMAEGARVDPDLLIAAQFMDEEWAYRNSIRGSVQPNKCSSLAVRSLDGNVMIGQNMDLGGYTDGHQVVLRIGPSLTERGALIFTISSMISLMGVNASGIAACVNALPQLPATPAGVPVAFVIRKLLQAATLDEAVSTIRTIPHATGQHYLIADPYQIQSFEASPVCVNELPVSSTRGFAHTNHPLATDHSGLGSGAINSIARLRSLNQRTCVDPRDIEWVKDALSSRDDPEHPISREAGDSGSASLLTGMISFTTGSMISILRQAAPDIETWISCGPPSVSGYTQHLLPGCQYFNR
jgi:isopenicillin-N N-acyltransferase like protein